MDNTNILNYGSGIVPGSAFYFSGALPLDGKYLVKTIEERDAHVSGNRAYQGMLVYVESEDKTYQYTCVSKDEETGVKTYGWEEFGFNQEKFDDGFEAKLVDNLTSTDADKALSAKQGKVLAGQIGSLEEQVLELSNDIGDAYDHIGNLPEDKTMVEYVDEAVQDLREYIGETPNVEDIDPETKEPITRPAKDVIEYINKKTEGIATDTALSNLQAELDKVEDDLLGLTGSFNDHVYDYNDRLSSIETKLEGIEEEEGAVKEALDAEAETRKNSDDAQVKRIASLEEQIEGLSGAMHFKGVLTELPTDEVIIDADYEDGDVVIVGNKEYVLNKGVFVEFGDASVNAKAITDLTDRVKANEDKLADVEANADVNIIEIVKVNGEVLTPDENKAVDITVPTDNKDLANGAGYLVASDIAGKADTNSLGALAFESKVSESLLEETLKTKINNKVDKVDGKGLSTNDLTDELKGQYDAAYAHSQEEHAPADAERNVIVEIKVNNEKVDPVDRVVNIAVPTGKLASKDSVAQSDLVPALSAEIDKISNKADANSVYTKTQIDEEIIGNVPNKVPAEEGGEATSQTVVEYIDSEVLEVLEVINTLNATHGTDKSELEGKIALKADASALAALETKHNNELAALTQTHNNDKAALEASIATKADAYDVISNDDIDAMFANLLIQETPGTEE